MQAIKARNTVIETASIPFIWSTDALFNGLEKMPEVRDNITRSMAKTKCKLNLNCQLDSAYDPL
uniref:Uncharacterized protein n=1 Tax=Tetranychus urticae TaxID=32264 RepID=T1KH27_TETUR